jgi:hypothetical protein
MSHAHYANIAAGLGYAEQAAEYAAAARRAADDAAWYGAQPRTAARADKAAKEAAAAARKAADAAFTAKVDAEQAALCEMLAAKYGA